MVSLTRALALALALFASPATGRAQISADTGRSAATPPPGAASAPGAAAAPNAAVVPDAAAPAAAPLPPSSDRVPPATDPEPAAPGAAGPGAPGLRVNVGVGSAQPSDTTLARACAGEPPGSEAPGLLAVIFRPGTSDRDRAAAAKAVGGSLAGTSDYGEEYVRLAVGAGPLAAVADRLIRQDPVVSVSPAPCPAEPAVQPAADSLKRGSP